MLSFIWAKNILESYLWISTRDIECKFACEFLLSITSFSYPWNFFREIWRHLISSLFLIFMSSQFRCSPIIQLVLLTKWSRRYCLVLVMNKLKLVLYRMLSCIATDSKASMLTGDLFTQAHMIFDEEMYLQLLDILHLAIRSSKTSGDLESEAVSSLVNRLFYFLLDGYADCQFEIESLLEIVPSFSFSRSIISYLISSDPRKPSTSSAYDIRDFTSSTSFKESIILVASVYQGAPLLSDWLWSSLR